MFTRFFRWLRNIWNPIPETIAPPSVAPHPQPRYTPPQAAPRAKVEPNTIKRRRQEMASAIVGLGFTDPIFDAPDGFFWKQDEGASDNHGIRRWRLYREKP